MLWRAQETTEGKQEHLHLPFIANQGLWTFCKFAPPPLLFMGFLSYASEDLMGRFLGCWEEEHRECELLIRK